MIVMRRGAWLSALTCLVCMSCAVQARAAPPTAEVAKMCRQLAIKAHPTRPAGSRTGFEQAQRDYFRDCVEKNSKEQKQN
jgi:hypothetical protein